MKTRFFYFAFIVMLASALTLTFADKRAFSIDDYYKIKRISDLDLSPDGERIAFSVTSYDFEKGESSRAIWIMDVHGKEKLQLTSGEKHDRSPIWSSDGKTIAFISDRSGEDQLYLISLRGGEARQLTKVSTGISSPLWSPNGSFIVFYAKVYPECGADDKCNKEIKETWDKGPLKAHMADALLYRHWDYWKDGKVRHIFSVDLEGKVKDLTPGPFDSPVFSLGGSYKYDISPDGKLLAFASKRVPHPSESTNSDIFMEKLEGELKATSAENATLFNKAADTIPSFSPDGMRLILIGQR